MKKHITWYEYQNFMNEIDPDNKYDYAFSGIHAISQDELVQKVKEHIIEKNGQGIPKGIEEALRPENNYTFEEPGYYDYMRNKKLSSKIMIYPIQRIYEDIYKKASGYDFLRKEISNDDWYSYMKLLSHIDSDYVKFQRGSRIYARDSIELKQKTKKYLKANCRHFLKEEFIKISQFYDYFVCKGYYDLNYEIMNPDIIRGRGNKIINSKIIFVMPIKEIYETYKTEYMEKLSRGTD
ncbi:hypothetical protein SAMN02745945_00966 [Peptoclostridium litorale DSM 5388]|uniref:Uncharacterized protein n=1 Tax=Peptoclostridium litorale DSM 5388 TaxID=1121324 RepID=A0A069R9R0_PEPLI|nr:hypothetical protein [Peptoclostridium litorale]KDR93771.1 hypothetical protein CLIT_23c00430 [Peptoclostridium litorale DSM 5388]SIN85541.1 hypothetical protein SAMN02745945_00966 [Peptoclostridium litorale DSM 5388]